MPSPPDGTDTKMTSSIGKTIVPIIAPPRIVESEITSLPYRINDDPD
jgi:hypothetical protein